jgi:hypothetical protein
MFNASNRAKAAHKNIDSLEFTYLNPERRAVLPSTLRRRRFGEYHAELARHPDAACAVHGWLAGLTSSGWLSHLSSREIVSGRNCENGAGDVNQPTERSR